MASVQTTKLLANLDSSELSTKAPSVYQIIRSLILMVDGLSVDVLTVQSALASYGVEGYGSDVTGFASSFTKRNIILSWSSLGAGYQYEIREGTVWDTASYVTTALGNSAPLDPRESGTYYFLIKATNTIGQPSENAASCTCTVPSVGSISLETQTVSNSVLMKWTEPASVFQIDYYNIYKAGVLLGRVSGTFYAFFELMGGIYTYSMKAVDIVGNESPLYSFTLTVGHPIDFSLIGHNVFTTFNSGSFSGTYPDILQGNVLIAPFPETHTWETHFTSAGAASIQDLIDAGYTHFPNASPSSGTYEKIIDLGAVYNKVSVAVAWQSTSVVGTVAITCQLEASEDTFTYGAPVAGTTATFEAIQLLRITLTFTSANVGHDFCILNSLMVDFGVQLEQDGGEFAALSTDAAGTVIAFNKIFKRVVSITVTALSTDPAYPTYDFDSETADPTTFKVKVYDSSGNRISKTVSWKARGIV